MQTRLSTSDEAAGADGDGTELVLKVKGMTCGHCVASVKQALESMDQVTEATPDLATGQVLVRGGFFETKALKQAIEGAGFEVVSRD
jgi:copper chaperone CopZ